MKHEWTKQPRRREGTTAIIHRVRCKTAPMAIDRITSKLGLPQRVILIQLEAGPARDNEYVISRHRKVSGAKRYADKL